jgi:Mg/Co/Ni transporter MgtE
VVGFCGISDLSMMGNFEGRYAKRSVFATFCRRLLWLGVNLRIGIHGSIG